MSIEGETAEKWAVVEIFGHRRRAGRVTEHVEYGASLLRIDIPVTGVLGDEVFATELYGGSSIFCLRVCDEAVARAAARQIGDVRPIAPTSFSQGQLFDQSRGIDDDDER